MREGWGGAERRGSRYCPPQLANSSSCLGGRRGREEENGEVDEGRVNCSGGKGGGEGGG